MPADRVASSRGRSVQRNGRYVHQTFPRNVAEAADVVRSERSCGSTNLRYDLPESAIAQHPVEPRDAARLLVALEPSPLRTVRCATCRTLVGPGDLVVVNDTRVLPARLHLHKATRRRGRGAAPEPRRRRASTLGGAGAAEQTSARRARNWSTTDGSPVVAWARLIGDGCRRRDDRRCCQADEADRLQRPRRDAAAALHPRAARRPRPLSDGVRPRAGLGRGADRRPAPDRGDCSTRAARPVPAVATVTLDVGLGTFRPMTTDSVEDHHMHAERYRVPDATLDAIAGADACHRRRHHRRFARLEACGRDRRDDRRQPSCSSTATTLQRGRPAAHELPPARFVVAGAARLVHRGAWRSLYEVALREGYRFLSFGDAMLVDRRARDIGRTPITVDGRRRRRPRRDRHAPRGARSAPRRSCRSGTRASVKADRRRRPRGGRGRGRARQHVPPDVAARARRSSPNSAASARSAVGRATRSPTRAGSRCSR